jgi:kinesin family protein 11
MLQNITNRPEVNQKLSKRTVLKEYTEEIERLRKELFNVREQQGVYIALENYQQMMTEVAIQSSVTVFRSVQTLQSRYLI